MSIQMKLRILIILSTFMVCVFASEEINCKNLEDCKIKFEKYVNSNLGKIHFLESIYEDEENEIYKTHGYGMFYTGNEKNKIEHITKVDRSPLHTETKYVLSNIFNNWFSNYFNSKNEKVNNNLIDIQNDDTNNLKGDFFVFVYLSPCYDCIDFYNKIQKLFPLLHFHIYYFVEYQNIKITNSLLDRKGSVFNNFTHKCKGTSNFCRQQILKEDKIKEKYNKIINGEKTINNNISFQKIGPNLDKKDFKKMENFYLFLKNL